VDVDGDDISKTWFTELRYSLFFRHLILVLGRLLLFTSRRVV